MILPCTCPHKAQDEFHGQGMRVHNPTKSGAARCTVCQKQVAGASVSSAIKTKTKKKDK